LLHRVADRHQRIDACGAIPIAASRDAMLDRRPSQQAGSALAVTPTASRRCRRSELRTALAGRREDCIGHGGTMQEVPASPIPPGGSALFTMWTSTAGASFMRRHAVVMEVALLDAAVL
jgi:hypothetical protein